MDLLVQERIGYNMKKIDNGMKQMLKEKYGECPIPSEAKERVIMGIEKAKKKKNENIVHLKWKVAEVAAACVCLVALANISSGTASALQKIPVIGSIARVVTFRNYTDTTNNHNASVKVPEIADTAGNSKDLEQTNTTIGKYADELIQKYEKDLKDSEGLGNCELQSDYQVIREDGNILVLEIDTTEVMASGSEYRKVFNIDKNAGRIKELADYFRKDSDYISVLSKEIKKQMHQQMKDTDKVYFLNQEDGFNRLSKDADFYFDTDGNLVILFDEYEVAPGYMGAVSFTISPDVFQDLLS